MITYCIAVARSRGQQMIAHTINHVCRARIVRRAFIINVQANDYRPKAGEWHRPPYRSPSIIEVTRIELSSPSRPAASFAASFSSKGATRDRGRGRGPGASGGR